jgi:glycosyltransferase involved in cell wall biosynthesis
VSAREAETLSISLVVPGYNEEAGIEDVALRSLAALRAYTDRPEVILVDDCSVDRTGEIADRLARENDAIRVIHNPLNLGVGCSLLIGMRAARGDIVMHNGMDEPFHLEDFGAVLACFPEADVVAVVRTDRSANSAYRALTSLANYWLLKLLFQPPFRDMNFVQAYKREVVHAAPVKARSPAFVTPELLMRAHDLGFRIAEVRATFHRRLHGRASHGKPRDILWTLSDMLSFRLEGRDVPEKRLPVKAAE